jgi:hypothetical protein
MKTIEDIGPQVLDDIRRLIQVDDEWAVIEPRSFTWWGHRLRQKVAVEESVTRGGLGIVYIWAETDLLIDVPNVPEVAEAIAILNSTAALNALVWMPEEGRVSLRCATCIYSEIRGWMTKMFCSAVAMQVAEAESRAEALQNVVGGRVHASTHPLNSFRQQPDDMLNILSVFSTAKDDLSPFRGDEMLNALAAFQTQVLTTGDESGMTMEFPFPGAIPPTVLARLLSDVPHPIYGIGLLVLMKLPSLPSGGPSAAELANALNVGEIGQLESGYSFGAWCSDVDGKWVAYAAFLPSATYMPGLLINMVVALSAKSHWVHLFLDLGNNTAEVGKWHKFQLKLLGLLSKSAQA